MKDLFWKAIFAIVILGIAVWVFSNKTDEKQSKVKKEKLETKQYIETKNIVSEMIDKHNAITNWDKSFNSSDSISLFAINSAYSVEVEDALINTTGQPILFFARISDIARKDGNYVIYFSRLSGTMLGAYSPANITYVLECTALQVDKILKMPRDKFDFKSNFAVIAQVTEVKKNRFQLDVVPSGGETVDIQFAPSNIFIATGNCLDLVFVGDYKPINSLGVNNK